MKILNKENIEIKNPNLSLGYLKKERILLKHHNAIEEQLETSHLELITKYFNGSADYKTVVDTPYQEAVEAWDEYEDIYRYTEYTPEELKQIEEEKNKPTQLDEIQAQVTYTAIKSSTLLLEQQPMALPVEEDITNSPRYKLNQNIQKWYKQHLWTETMVNEAAEKGILTQEELINLTQQ